MTRKRRVLFVDPDVGAISAFQAAAGHRYAVFGVEGADGARRLLSSDSIDVLVAELLFPDGVEWTILRQLVEHRSSVVHRSDLIAIIRLNNPSQDRYSPRTIDVYIARLRVHCARVTNVDCIRTVRGKGYEWVGPEVVIDHSGRLGV